MTAESNSKDKHQQPAVSEAHKARVTPSQIAAQREAQTAALKEIKSIFIKIDTADSADFLQALTFFESSAIPKEKTINLFTKIVRLLESIESLKDALEKTNKMFVKSSEFVPEPQKKIAPPPSKYGFIKTKSD